MPATKTSAGFKASPIAAIERPDPRPMPQTPWPLVQPEPSRVPKPTRTPASATTGSVALMCTAGSA